MKTAKKFILFIIILYLSNAGVAAQSLLQSGPMVGYSTMKEVCLWAQTKSAANVKFVYWNINDVQKRFSTKEVMTKEEDGFTVKLIADQLEPGKHYSYEILINGKKVEIAVTKILNGEDIANRDALANPESLSFKSATSLGITSVYREEHGAA